MSFKIDVTEEKPPTLGLKNPETHLQYPPNNNGPGDTLLLYFHCFELYFDFDIGVQRAFIIHWLEPEVSVAFMAVPFCRFLGLYSLHCWDLQLLSWWDVRASIITA